MKTNPTVATQLRLPVAKTPKVYVGGAFIRSESGLTYPLKTARGAFVANIPQCTRKDLRNAVEAAAKASVGWAKRSGYNRGQILYRLAEMLEARQADMAAALLITAKSPERGSARAASMREVTVAVDRLVYYAGWADKYEQVLGSVNPVASSYFNFTVTEPMGVIGVIAPDAPALLGLVSLIAPIITSGNSVVASASEVNPYPAILLGEMLATSDLPSGVVNVLTGFRSDLAPTFATHEQLRGLSAAVSSSGTEERKMLSVGAAESVKRVHYRAETSDWFADSAQDLYRIRDFVEFKTTWHPIGA